MKCSRTRAKKEISISTLPTRHALGPGTLWVKRRGRGTYANDRPPVLGTVGRVSGQLRLRVVTTTQQTTLRAHVEQLSGPGTQVYTDQYDSYATIERPHTTVCHAAREWARDADGDGARAKRIHHLRRDVGGVADVFASVSWCA